MHRAHLLLLTIAHFCVDSYASMLSPALLFIAVKFDLSYSTVGQLVALVSLSSISQPLMGIWADRMSRRYLVTGGLCLAAIFTPLMGVAPSFATVALVLVLGGFGVAAFHPQVFALVGELSGSRRALGIALFIFGGTLAIGATPIWVPWVASRYGLEILALAAVPGLLLALLVGRRVPLANPHIQQRSTSLRESLDGAGWPLGIITLVVILRSITHIGFHTYIPFLGEERGMSELEWGLALSVYAISGVVFSLLFGYLADLMSPKPLVWGSILLSSPALYLYQDAQGLVAYLLLIIGGGMIGASNSVLVAMAQQLAPRNAALASGLPLGFSWGVATLFMFPIGHLADRVGLTPVLSWVALLPLVTAAVALLLPRLASEKAPPSGDLADRTDCADASSHS